MNSSGVHNRERKLQLQELVDEPRERLDVEYKAWLDLSKKEVRAKIAKHLCALANSGGGFLVFGIDNEMNPAEPRPCVTGPYDQDTLSAIVKSYLTPTFQVAVHQVTSAKTKTTHPVVWVPSHGATPVCSARGGPQIGGKPVGIVAATHYTREAGPASVAISKPEQWAPVIRRCVIHERRTLLVGLETLLRSPGTLEAEQDEALLRWHNAAYRRFREVVESTETGDLRSRAHYQLSYQIVVAGSARLEMAGFLNEARQMGREVVQHVDSGWTMFWVFDRDEFRPRSVSDEALGEEEFLECSLEGNPEQMSPDFWRMSPAGLATIIKPFSEDRWEMADEFAAGTWLWPAVLVREIAEVTAHARAFSQRFEAPEAVILRCDWHGLKGRRLKDHTNFSNWDRYGSAQDNTGTLQRTVTVASLRDDWCGVTADIVSRVVRMFDADASISAAEVRSTIKRLEGWGHLA